MAHFYAGHGGVCRSGAPFFIERLGLADLAGYTREKGLLELMLQAFTAHTSPHLHCPTLTSRLTHLTITPPYTCRTPHPHAR